MTDVLATPTVTAAAQPQPVVPPRPSLPAQRRRALSSRTPEDRLTLVGAAVGSLGFVWLLYERLLPFSGRFGFVMAWFVLFVVFYAGLTAMSAPRAVVLDRVASTVVIAAPVVVGLALASMLVFTFFKGWKAFHHRNFFTQTMATTRPTDSLSDGGIVHAIVGTLIEVGIAVAIALPLGIATAVFLSEVGGPLARWVKTVVEAMTALPSIVAGLFIYTVLLVDLHVPRSGIAAAIALAVMGLPIMARSADVVLRVVPGGLREASYALGATRWQTVWRVVLPSARPGLATALILSIARMVGETSPVLLTSGASNVLNTNPLNHPMNSLPLFIYTSVRSGETQDIARGFGAAAVLLALVITLFTLARLAARPRKVR
ncbi:phosphate ABC transporter membrane protein 2, PhoT family [Frankineae bacterium MT45]|nr:phosphate ABC transporter membrane protein 2, PhoT family [Frankineae bacterium MT45]